jgi:hypothetical protein
MRNILLLLIACIMLVITLLSIQAPPRKLYFTNDQLFEDFVLRQIYDFGYPHERVRTRSVVVNENFSRQIITIDVNRSFPRTFFHKTLSDTLRYYDIQTYAVVLLPDPVLEIHLIKSETVVKTLRVVRLD